MKFLVFVAFLSTSLISTRLSAQSNKADTEGSTGASASNNLYMDVHHFGPGKVTYKAVSEAHARDLATEKKYGVHFINFWLDDANGTVYCLSSSPDTLSIHKTHAEAHGLLPDEIYQVSSGSEGSLINQKNFFLDVHEFGPGKVSAKDVAGAHQKDLATQQKYGVNIINYWLDEKDGRVVCLSQAPDSNAIIQNHKEAHGLIPAYVVQVKPGN